MNIANKLIKIHFQFCVTLILALKLISTRKYPYIVLNLTFENEFSGIIYSFSRARQNVFLTMSGT